MYKEMTQDKEMIYAAGSQPDYRVADAGLINGHAIHT